MAENRRLIQSTSSYNGKSQYGSVGYDRDTPGADDVTQTRFVYRKRDCTVVTILGAMVAVAIVTTLLIGIPNIRRKADAVQRNQSEATTSGLAVPVPANPGGKTNGTGSSPAYPSASSKGIYVEAAVTTNCIQCSNIAAAVLKRNGSAVDAAIAATFCLSVTDLHHTGLGGGFVMTIYNREKHLAEVLDARETAPYLANATMFSTKQAASTGGLSVAVPGLVRGLWEAHRRHGRIDWSTLIEPSVDLCENGFRVGLSLANALQQGRDKILLEPTLRSLLVNASTNNVFQVGDLLRQPVLGETFRVLARDGGDALYDGPLATKLIGDIQSLGGILGSDDLANYTVVIKKPITVDYESVSGRGNLKLYSAPPPLSGALVAFFLNILEGYNMTSLETVSDFQRVVEALKFTYAKRAELSDPDYEDMTELVSNLTSKEYAKQIRSLIRENATFAAEYYGHTYLPPDAGTSHVSVVAPNGDSVTVTSTINQKFGAMIASESTGIILNDEMDDFSSKNIVNFFGVPPSEANFIVPGKRPVSSMCPTIITDADGNVVLTTGASGGTVITSATAIVILRHLWMGQDLKETTDTPRMHHQLYPNQLNVESGFPTVVIKGLSDIGHNVQVVATIPTAVNSIGKRSSQHSDPLIAVADRRVDAGQSGF